MRPLIAASEADLDAAAAVRARLTTRRPRRRALRLFVPAVSFERALFYAAVATLLAAPFYDSPWLAGALFTSVLVAMHALTASRRIPWIPGLMALIAAIQWDLAAWASYHLPEMPVLMRMSLGPGEYFPFAAATLIAYVAGLYIPLWGEGKREQPPLRRERITPALRRLCNAMIFGGMALRLVVVPVAPMSVRGLVYMASNLMYVGAFTFLLAREPGWRWRLALVLLAEAYWDSRYAQYLEIVLWSIYSLLLLVHVHRIRPWKLLVGAVLGGCAIIVINTAKHAARDQFQTEQGFDPNERAAIAATYATDALASPDQLFSAKTLSFNVARLNQGVITSRIIFWTPDHEPFAHGETIATAIYAAIVPRVLDPDKFVAGGYENYPRFTGLELLPGTSINLSIPGEIYANFGVFGAIVGCFIYGIMLSLLYRMFVRLARRSSLWWAWAPFILLSTIIAESGLGETLNQVSKSLLIMWAIVTFIPAWAQLRAPRRGRKQPKLAPPPVQPVVAEAVV